MRTRVLVREVMNSPVITAQQDEGIDEIARKMATSKAGSVVITDKEAPIGIVTEGDIVSKIVSKDARASRFKASELMSTPLHMIESEKEIIEAARAMRRFGIKRLGVSYKRRLVGIISITDILAITPELFDIISEKAAVLTATVSKQPTFLAGYCDVCNQWSDNLLEIDGKFVCSDCTSGKEEPEDRDEM